MENKILQSSPISSNNRTKERPWLWVPSLYFAEGIPYTIVVTLSLVMYKLLGISNAEITFYTGLLYLPWVIKPFWSPFVEMFKTKRYWIVVMQMVIGVGFACVALTIPAPGFFKYTLAFLWLLAFSSATHDIAADGFYMLALDQGKQSYFVGIRSTFYRLAMLAGQGLLVIIAGSIESGTGQEPVYFTVKAVQTNEIVLKDSIKSLTQINKGFAIKEITEIKIENSVPSFVDSLKKDIKSKNISNGFVQEEKKMVDDGSGSGFWTRNISAPLGKYLKEKFGESKSGDSKSKIGNIGIACIKLNSKPEPVEKMVLNLNRHKGSNDINIVEGTRLEFDQNNWDKLAYVAFQLDSKLSHPTETLFIGRSGNVALSWSITFLIITLLFFALAIYHRFILPYPTIDIPAPKTSFKVTAKTFFVILADFFKKKQVLLILAFILFYRLAEAQLVRITTPFLLDSTETGGLGLTTSQYGIYYGTVGIIALSLGGILGGILVSRKGLKYWLWWMVAALHLPDLIFVYFSIVKPESHLLISSGVAIEQFGYGFGLTAFMMYIIYVADGQYKTAHYAIATGIMALGMMLPGMFSGWLQEIIGYQNFFIWVILCTIPGILVVAFLKIDPEFGKKVKTQGNS
jgi:MFS transporter, PAT family, beta-lactamase induction signal transducer AmpG